MLRAVDDAIAMHALLWPDEIRAPEGVAPDTTSPSATRRSTSRTP